MRFQSPRPVTKSQIRIRMIPKHLLFLHPELFFSPSHTDTLTHTHTHFFLLLLFCCSDAGYIPPHFRHVVYRVRKAHHQRLLLPPFVFVFVCFERRHLLPTHQNSFLPLTWPQNQIIIFSDRRSADIILDHPATHKPHCLLPTHTRIPNCVPRMSIVVVYSIVQVWAVKTISVQQRCGCPISQNV